jgi:imidazolonepropionase-like amidohydrolase
LVLASLVFAGLAANACAADAPRAVAIVDARVVTVSGPVLNRGTVVLRNGLIEAVGEGISVPLDAEVVEGDGLTVYPGLIDALSNWGLPSTLAPAPSSPRGRGQQQDSPGTLPPPARGPEDRPSTASWVKAADELQANDRRFESVRAAGFTAAAAFPMRNIFAGQGSMIYLGGQRARDLVIVPSLGQYISLTVNPLGGGFPGSLMGVISYIRQIYLDADRYVVVKATPDPQGLRRPEYDRALEGVLESKRILLPADRLVEMDRMLRLAAEVKQPAILYGLHEGYRAVDLLKKSGAPVLISLRWPELVRERDADPQNDSLHELEVRDQAPSTPAILKKAGVPFAFYSDGLDLPRELQRGVKKAMDAGLSREDAVRALTLSVAEIWGVADRLGSIDQGKIANLVVTQGDLFDEKTQVEMVFIDGVKYPMLTLQERPTSKIPPPVTQNNQGANQ